MKKTLKGFCLVMFISLLCFTGNAQIVSVSGARTLIPGLYAGLRYHQFTGRGVDFAGVLYTETASLNRLNYAAYGADILAVYNGGADETEQRLTFRMGLGATVQTEHEPWVYKDFSFSQRLNYGIASELQGLWNMTEAFALAVFAQQKFLFNKLLGTTHFLIGLSVSYRMGL